ERVANGTGLDAVRPALDRGQGGRQAHGDPRPAVEAQIGVAVGHEGPPRVGRNRHAGREKERIRWGRTAFIAAGTCAEKAGAKDKAEHQLGVGHRYHYLGCFASWAWAAATGAVYTRKGEQET